MLIINNLQDNADAVEEIGYTHRFTPDELAQKKESLAETSIQINDIEIEKKEAMEAFKAELKPLNEMPMINNYPNQG